MKALWFILGVLIPISTYSQNLTLVVYKHEKIMESWVEGKCVRVDTICRMSGRLGPKREQGDQQVPEGIYRVTNFNPNSSYVLSFGINYPNIVDRFSGRKRLGGDIYFHGSCVSAGCVSFKSDQIREIYTFVRSFKTTDVLIFPGTDSVFEALSRPMSDIRLRAQVWERRDDGMYLFYDPLEKHMEFWELLRKIHTAWVQTRKIPRWKPSAVGYEILGTSYTPG